jgi:WD40 repeat protein
MSSATPIASSNVGLSPNSYIYKIISTAPRQDPLTYSTLDQLAILSSDDSLRFLDPTTLSATGVIKNANAKVTCLERANDAPSNVVATAGRDGLIRFWDKRSRQKVLEIESRMLRRSKCMSIQGRETNDDSAQTHLGPGLQRTKQLHRSWYRKPRRWTRLVASIYLVQTATFPPHPSSNRYTGTNEIHQHQVCPM